MIPTPMKVAEYATCACVAISAPDDMPDTDILVGSTLYFPTTPVICFSNNKLPSSNSKTVTIGSALKTQSTGVS